MRMKDVCVEEVPRVAQKLAINPRDAPYREQWIPEFWNRVEPRNLRPQQDGPERAESQKRKSVSCPARFDRCVLRLVRERIVDTVPEAPPRGRRRCRAIEQEPQAEDGERDQKRSFVFASCYRQARDGDGEATSDLDGDACQKGEERQVIKNSCETQVATLSEFYRVLRTSGPRPRREPSNLRTFEPRNQTLGPRPLDPSNPRWCRLPSCAWGSRLRVG